MLPRVRYLEGQGVRLRSPSRCGECSPAAAAEHSTRRHLTLEHGPAGSLLCLLECAAESGPVAPNDFISVRLSRRFASAVWNIALRSQPNLPGEQPASIYVFGNPVQSDPSLVLGDLLLVGGDSNYWIRFKGLLQEPWKETGVIK